MPSYVDPRRVVMRYLAAGDIVGLPKRNLITIAGRKYALSNDGGPLGLGDEEDPGMVPQGGARLIVSPQANKWKYLWVYDTDKQIVSMWRTTDGNNKVWGSARSLSHDVMRIEKKRHLNRVDHDEFRKIEREMDRRLDENTKALEQLVKDNETDFQKRVNEETQAYFDKVVRPEVERAISIAQSGAALLGFKPHSPEGLDRQRQSYALGQVFKRLFTEDKVEAYLKHVGLDVETSNDSQAAHWAVTDITYAAYDEYLPSRD